MTWQDGKFRSLPEKKKMYMFHNIITKCQNQKYEQGKKSVWTKFKFPSFLLLNFCFSGRPKGSDSLSLFIFHAGISD